MIYYALKPFNKDTTLSYGDRKYIATETGQAVVIEFKPDSDMLEKAGLISTVKPEPFQAPAAPADDGDPEVPDADNPPQDDPDLDPTDDEPKLEDEGDDPEEEEEDLTGRVATVKMRGRDVKVHILGVDETVAHIATVSTGKEYEVDVDELTLTAITDVDELTLTAITMEDE